MTHRFQLKLAPRQHRSMRTGALLSIVASAALGTASPALAQESQAVGRVISSTPIAEEGRPAGYSVTYEYAGRQYTTRIASPPGPTLPLQVGDYGVTTYPVAPQASLTEGPSDTPGPASEGDATGVEPGVVVSRDGTPYGAAPAPHPGPMYAVPYGPAPYAAYPAPYVYPPIGLSLNWGYSRGWHRRWR